MPNTIDECVKQLLAFNDQLRQQQASLRNLQGQMNLLMLQVQAVVDSDNPNDPCLAVPPNIQCSPQMVRDVSTTSPYPTSPLMDEEVERAISMQFDAASDIASARTPPYGPSGLLKSMSGVSVRGLFGMIRSKTGDIFLGSDGSSGHKTASRIGLATMKAISRETVKSEKPHWRSINSVHTETRDMRKRSITDQLKPHFTLDTSSKIDLSERSESMSKSLESHESLHQGCPQIIFSRENDDLEAQDANDIRKEASKSVVHLTPQPEPPAPIRKPVPAASETKLQRPSLISSLYLIYCAVPRYNEFGAKLLDTEFAVLFSQVDNYNASHLLHPRSEFRTYWDFSMSFLYLIMLFVIPISVGFPKAQVNMTPFSISFTFFFACDNLINLFTIAYREGLPLSTWESCKRYLSGRFALDLFTALPLDIVFAGSDIPYPECFLLLRLFRLWSLYTIVVSNPLHGRFSNWFQHALGVGGSFMSVWLFGALLLIYLHLYACGTFLMGKLTGYVSWANLPTVLEKSPSEQYTWAFFAAIGNTFPITGFRPTTALEQWTTIICCLVGALLYASLVGTISSFSFGLDSSGRMYKQKMDEVNEYMAYKNLGDTLKRKVRSFFQLKYRGKYFDEASILKELNDSLRQEITIHNCRDLIAKVNFLSRNVGDGRDLDFLGRIANALKAVYYIKGDTIFEQGKVGNEMYFILSGMVEIIVANNRVATLSDGAFFGEVALLGQVPRTATIRAAADTVAYRLDRSDFEAILADFDDMAIRIRLVYEERMAKVRKEKEMVANQQVNEPSKNDKIPVPAEKPAGMKPSDVDEEQA
ncbi:uncharacterized protein SPPG_05498 [Spizellomyces punctatus DAOM BR117]|uniref:Cyclic nucleotide-binding domain-containing protein n=1 Tax=Spizellomyces punctatus (strain DAOM BR117) TaxID=645134 RepID=A0A0L0HDN6_SPIPD|nr:uncharacterized protein SPPG_05498 [Spizellomyces punctatus DAOM BR117]KNC99242.1 hypothetical protein SPPG_05498 [Spizellomyces punctatus DAOM BR117]|eukprot:XP_016607282.1 hypothetical protein SPPG_05498 [Spizellomyces punctatus DAOM BR117]